MSNEAWRRIRAVGENVVLYPFSKGKSRDWEAQELAEFYRVENVLIQSGMRVVTDQGVSDEGDPWFVFCRESDGETVVHFARIDGQFVIVSPAYEGIARGQDFRTMIREMIDRHKLSLTSNDKDRSNVYMHPAVLLVVLVGAAFFKTPSSAQADEFRKDLPQGAKSEFGSKSVTARIQSSGEKNYSFLPDAQQSQTDQAALRNLWLIASAAALGFTDEADAAAKPTIFAHETLSGEEPEFDSVALAVNLDDGEHPNSLLSTQIPEASVESHLLIGSDWADQFAPLPAHVSNIDLASTVKNKEALTLELVVTTPTPGSSVPIFDHAPYYAAVTHSRIFPLAGATTLSDASGQLNERTSEKPPRQKEASLGDQLPQHAKNTVALTISAEQVGSALTFLNENKILEFLQAEGSENFQGILAFQNFSLSDIEFDVNVSQRDSSKSNEDLGDVIITYNQILGSETLSDVDFVKAISAFLQEGNNVSLKVSDGIYIFAEETLGMVQDKITATFKDGSAISIIGQPELLQSILSDLV